MNDIKNDNVPIVEGNKIMITIDSEKAYHVTVDKGVTGIEILRAAQTLIDCIVASNEDKTE